MFPHNKILCIEVYEKDRPPSWYNFRPVEVRRSTQYTIRLHSSCLSGQRDILCFVLLKFDNLPSTLEPLSFLSWSSYLKMYPLRPFSTEERLRLSPCFSWTLVLLPFLHWKGNKPFLTWYSESDSGNVIKIYWILGVIYKTHTHFYLWNFL